MDELVKVYACLCDRTRLRILGLLCHGPLCVCHLQQILGEPQVKVSKHLRYLKTHGMVQVRRESNWRIYSLVTRRTRSLESNLACLQDCTAEDKTFRRDAEKLRALRGHLAGEAPACCTQPLPVRLKASGASRPPPLSP